MNLLKTVLTYAALFSVGAVTSVACFEPELDIPSFRCNPALATAQGDNGCPGEETCCSDDPAAVGGKLPNYYMDGVVNEKYGAPLFSDNNNALSSQGMCVKTGDFDSPLVNGCPTPCNPTWDSATINDICKGAQCCQTQELDPARDCIMVEGKWRAANGSDVIAGRSGWGGEHATNQDPIAAGCKTFSQGDDKSLRDCIGQLGVASSRGFCYVLGCPCIEDVCEMKNPDYVARCTGAPPPAGV
ncbi:hypothetical protein [Nannocystis punicea]|uniref:Uncharacterized protein n=1 Tax=Nannocystis punicea TaxID=2995304 RepID=A0ABY7H2C7_9BACT|nr:hypothetical protein [Nannocystis poenicansa]WAS93404.1 hypothetical protein O0S08_45245 [Nannocystis poenicansa]